MQNEAEEPGDDSQNEKTPTSKHPKKVPKTPEFVDTDSDDEQGLAVKQPRKAPKTREFVDTGSDDSGDEQEPTAEASEFVDTDTDHTGYEQGSPSKQPKNASKTTEYPYNEQVPAVKILKKQQKPLSIHTMNQSLQQNV